MRLHQRVGRLNRYGQTEPVEVLTLRNPDTVESRIWTTSTQSSSASRRRTPARWTTRRTRCSSCSEWPRRRCSANCSADAPADVDRLADWFDATAGRFGGDDAVDAVKQMVGHCARFDFGRVGGRLPRVDLADLRPLLVALLAHLRRRIDVGDDGSLSFKTPDGWDREVGVRARYDRLSFDRAGGAAYVAGVGHKLIDRALHEALDYPAVGATVPRELLATPLHVLPSATA